MVLAPGGRVGIAIEVIPLAAAGRVSVVRDNTDVSLRGFESVVARSDNVLVTKLDDERPAAERDGTGAEMNRLILGGDKDGLRGLRCAVVSSWVWVKESYGSSGDERL